MDQSIPHPNAQNITASLAIDASGLPLGHTGDISPECSGAYSAICKLASGLDHHDASNSNNSGGSAATVIIEGEKDATLIKEYHGRIVVFKVPTASLGGGNTESSGTDEDHASIQVS